MARSKKEDAVWESHRQELKVMFLDQGLTVEQIQQHMSRQYHFLKSKGQYCRQFKKWNFKKYLTSDDWRFIGHRREKRKREGRDPGSVTANGTVISEDTIRKQLPRHVLPSAQYLATVGGEPEPATPEGIVVGTPKLEIQAANSQTVEMQIERPLGLAETQVIIPDIQMPDYLPTVDGIHGQSGFQITELLRSYIRDLDFVAWYHTDPSGAIGELDALVTAVLNTLFTEEKYLPCEFPIVMDMVKNASLSFAEFFFNLAWQTPRNLRATIGKNFAADLIKSLGDDRLRTVALKQAKFLMICNAGFALTWSKRYTFFPAVLSASLYHTPQDERPSLTT